MDRRLDAIVDELMRRAGEARRRRWRRWRATSSSCWCTRRAAASRSRRWRPTRRACCASRSISRARARDDAGLGGAAGLDREATRLSYPTWLLEVFVEDYGRRRRPGAGRGDEPARADGGAREHDAHRRATTLAAQLAEEHVIAQPDAAVAGRAGVRDARQRVRAVGVPRRAVRGDGRRQPAGRRAGGAAAGRARRSTRAPARAARRWRWARRWRARGGCWRSTPTARSWRSCAAARAAPG